MMRNLNSLLGARVDRSGTSSDHDLAEKIINKKVREFYPEFNLYIVLDEDSSSQNFYASSAQNTHKYVKFAGRQLINLVYSILSDKKLHRFKPALKLMLDHEARHVSNGCDEFDAQMYALSKAKDPLGSLSKGISIHCYLMDVSPENALNDQLEYWGRSGIANRIDFPISEKAKAKVIRRAEKYVAFLKRVRSDAGNPDIPLLHDNVIPWSRVYL